MKDVSISIDLVKGGYILRTNGYRDPGEFSELVYQTQVLTSKGKLYKAVRELIETHAEQGKETQ